MASPVYTDVDTRKILNTASVIENHINELSAVATVLDQEIAAALNPCWEGNAKNSFDIQFTLFKAAYKRLIQKYQLLNEELKKAGAAYEKTDAAARQASVKVR